MNNVKILYWCPFISKVATIKAVVNSAEGLIKYSKNTIKPEIINVFGEWSGYQNELYQKNIPLSKSMIKFNFLNYQIENFVISRLKYFTIFIFSFIPLIKYLKQKKFDFLMVHLVTSLPLFIFILFNFKTKLILRISGMPKLNFFRNLLWKLSSKKIYKITCPTQETYDRLKEIPFLKKKLYLLRDPVLYVKEIIKMKKEKIDLKLTKKNFILAVGRLTKQKNFLFLIENFRYIKNNDLDLVIVGEGEEKKKILKLIDQLNLNNRVHMINYTKNVFNLIKECEYFVLTSLWEDPGFVLIEAAFMNKIILASDCPSGPKEILKGGQGGFLYKSNDSKDFILKFELMNNSNIKKQKKKKINAKNSIKEFSIFRHYKNLENLLTK